jgi:hypothetical protein
MELNSMTLEQALDGLREQGFSNTYTKFKKDSVKRYAVLCVCDSSKDEIYLYECGYILEYYDDIDDAMSYIGCIFCGGVYTAIGLYDNGMPIANEYLDNISFTVPNGNTKIQSSEEDDCI